MRGRDRQCENKDINQEQHTAQLCAPQSNEGLPQVRHFLEIDGFSNCSLEGEPGDGQHSDSFEKASDQNQLSDRQLLVNISYADNV